jgi:hypothetical protein
MQISDISAYADNARPYAGDKKVEHPPGKVPRNTLRKHLERAAAGADAAFLPAGVYKGNFIDIYV